MLQSLAVIGIDLFDSYHTVIEKKGDSKRLDFYFPSCIFIMFVLYVWSAL